MEWNGSVVGSWVRVKEKKEVAIVCDGRSS